QPHSVWSFLEDMHFGGDAGFSKSEVVVHAVFSRNGRIGIRLEDKGRWSVLCNCLFSRKTFCEDRIRIVAQQIILRTLMGPRLGHRDDGISKDHEIWTAAGSIQRVSRAGITGI